MMPQSNCSKSLALRASGSGDPQDIIACMPDVSAVCIAALSMTRWNWTGTIAVCVMPSRPIIAAVRAASNFSSITSVPPARKVHSIITQLIFE